MREELNEKERILGAVSNDLAFQENEISVLAQKSQMMMKEAKSETA